MKKHDCDNRYQEYVIWISFKLHSHERIFLGKDLRKILT